LDLDCQEDPAWFYLQSQFSWICESLREEFANAEAIIVDKSFSKTSFSDDSKRGSLIEGQENAEDDAKDEKLEDIKMNEGTTVDFVGNDHATKKLVHSVGMIMRTRIPIFWKSAKSVLEGKFKRVWNFEIVRFDILFRKLCKLKRKKRDNPSKFV
jgi:exocyst complex component 2